MKTTKTLFALCGAVLAWGNTAYAQYLDDVHEKHEHKTCCAFHDTHHKATTAARRVISASTAKDVELSNGIYVNIVNKRYETTLEEGFANNDVTLKNVETANYRQVWKVVADNGKWRFQNALTGRYIASKGGGLSSPYSTSTNGHAFNVAPVGDNTLKDYTIYDTGTAYLHAQADANLVGWWDKDVEPSQWVFRKVEVNEADLAKVKENIKEAQKYANSTNVSLLRVTLTNYFSDYACTQLKPEYQSMSDEDLKTLLAQTSAQNPKNRMPLPQLLIDMVLKVKNNAWTHREKEFRFYNYKAYSDHEVWNGNGYLGTGYPLSPQTGPTGVSVKKGEPVLIFVDSNYPAYTDLEVMLCEGMNISGATKKLQRGYNAIVADKDAHVFIKYVLKRPNIKLSEAPAIPIHIEGGYVNGYFDITRGHTNRDWNDMVDHLFKDPIIHLKNRYHQYNLQLDAVKNFTNRAETDLVAADGVPKGIVGVLRRWDSLVDQYRNVMGLDSAKTIDYCNSMFSASASSGGNPYASNFGTYYPGTADWINYMQFTRGWENDEGGNFWMVGHEVGHLHQKAINIAGDTEMSVNFFSQIARYQQGSNVGRGRPLSNTMGSFHRGDFYHKYDLWQRSRMYFQLWLYYHVMGHKPDFYPKLFEALRKDPMEYPRDKNNPGSGLVNYLKFAVKASQAAGEDLSEFFQFYGFFVPLKNFEVGDYSNSYFTTTQADIDKAIAEMKKLPKKAHPGIFFIDERIRTFKTNNPEVSGTRVATSADATPGVPAEVGQMGMHLDFRNDLDIRDYKATYTASTGRLALSGGKGAVGVKFYDENGKLIYVSNTFSTVLPSELRNTKFYVNVAYGNGYENTVYDPNTLSSITTVVNEATAQQGEDKVYDLTGRRSDAKQSGVYIVNGKIVVK